MAQPEPTSSGGPGSPAAVPEEWLKEFGNTRATDQLERLEGDIALINELVLTGYSGPLWNKLANALAEYGHQVLITWIRTELIFGKCAEKGLGMYLAGIPRLRLTNEDVEDITQETIIRALASFKETVLREGRWDPKKGASLKTFFVGQCLIRFTSVYRKESLRIRRENGTVSTLIDTSASNDLHSETDDPQKVLGHEEDLHFTLDQIPSREARVAAWLISEGYSQPEIAEILGTTVGSIESHLYRYRKANRPEDESQP